ncbi:MAG: hypothetical protein AAB575_04570 [Patescibacteria group bacterium]
MNEQLEKLIRSQHNDTIAFLRQSTQENIKDYTRLCVTCTIFAIITFIASSILFHYRPDIGKDIVYPAVIQFAVCTGGALLARHHARQCRGFLATLPKPPQ